MKRIWTNSLSRLLAPLALAVAVPAIAAQESEQAPGQMQQHQGQPQMAPQGQSSFDRVGKLSPAETGVLQGTVRAIDFRAGIMEVSASGRTIALHAKPDELASFHSGDLVSIDYDDYAGVLWLASHAGGATMGNQNFAISGTVSGTVTGLNKARGYVTVLGSTRTRTFLAHPSDLLDLVPGQFVSLSFERIGGADWVSSINQAAPGQAAPGNADQNAK